MRQPKSYVVSLPGGVALVVPDHDNLLAVGTLKCCLPEPALAV